MRIHSVNLNLIRSEWRWDIYSEAGLVDSGEGFDTIEEAAQTALAAARCADTNGCQRRRQVTAWNHSSGWCQCLRCGHQWHTRGDTRNHYRAPVRCAKCRSPLWNKPRIRNRRHHPSEK